MLTRLDRAVTQLDVRDLVRRRWFAGKGREPISARLVDALEVPGAEGGALLLVDVEHADGWSERYGLPARLEEGKLVEASPADALWPALARLVSVEAELQGLEGVFLTVPGPGPGEVGGSGRALTHDQSNTSVVLGERDVVKCYRRHLAGVHPEPELLAAELWLAQEAVRERSRGSVVPPDTTLHS